MNDDGYLLICRFVLIENTPYFQIYKAGETPLHASIKILLTKHQEHVRTKYICGITKTLYVLCSRCCVLCSISWYVRLTYTYCIERMCMVIIFLSVVTSYLLPGVCNLGSVWYIVRCLCYAVGKYNMSVIYNRFFAIQSYRCERCDTKAEGICCMCCMCCIWCIIQQLVYNLCVWMMFGVAYSCVLCLYILKC